jgi:hypothetical protein
MKALTREFRLSPPGKGLGVSCDAEGAFVGAIPILERLQKNSRDAWQLRDCEELSEQISMHYGLPIDMSSKTGGLRAIASALNEGDVARAQIATVLLGIPDPPPLFKGDFARDRMITLVRDLHWSGLLKWDPDEHPRWPAGSDDSIGGRFAPKGEGAETTSSNGNGSVEPSTATRGPRIQLTDANVSDASDDSIAEAEVEFNSERRTSQRDDTPDIILAAAEGEDERDPRLGIGGNHPPPEELIPQRLQQSPAGPAVQFFDNFWDISGPGDEANAEMGQLLMNNLLHRIHEIDPNYVDSGIWPPGFLAGMTWQERLGVINRLQAELAATICRVRGDIRPLQEVTFDFMQRATNSAYVKAVQRYNAGELKFQLSPEVAIGNDMDSTVRLGLREFYNGLGISMDSGSAVRVNRRAYDSSRDDVSYRLPDARVGNLAFEVSLTAKQISDRQIEGFFNADFKPVGVVMVRPNQLGNDSSYVIWRPKEW